MQAPAVAAADRGAPPPQPAPVLAPDVLVIGGGPADSTAAVLRRLRLFRLAYAPAAVQPVPPPLREGMQRRRQARITVGADLLPSDRA